MKALNAKLVIATAQAILGNATETSKANPFGSVGELVHNVEMVRIWGDDHVRDVVLSLARISSQRGIDSDPFVWDEPLCTYLLDEDRLEVMCHKLSQEADREVMA